MSPIAPPTAALAGVLGLAAPARTTSTTDAGEVVAFLILGGGFLLVVWTAIFLWVRVRSDRPLPVRLTTPMVVGALQPVRFEGAAIFAVDGHRLSFNASNGELVLDGSEATIRGESRFWRPIGKGERTIRREEVERILVSRWRPIPYVEFVDDVRAHGITRFYGGTNLVQALRERGWPVPDDDAADESSAVSETGGGPPRD